MPGFTFEKISPPAELETGGPISPVVRRGAIARFIDRLTSTRVKKSDDDGRKAQEPKRGKRT